MSKNTKKLVPKLRFPEFRNAQGWAEDTFGGAATFLNGRAYKQEELLEQGKYRVLRVGNFFTNNNWYYSDLELEEDKYCDRGDLLYAWSASFGPRIWHDEKVIYHYHIWKVLEKNRIDKKFLFILLDYETERMKSQSANGLGLMHITKGAIESWKCFMPEKDEQQKIANCLSSIDDLITAQTQKVEALKTHKKGLLQQLFPREGETVPRLRFPEFRDSGEWSIGFFDDAVKIIDGDRGVNYPKAEDFSRRGFCVFLNAKNVTKNGFSFEDVQFVSEDKDKNLKNGKLNRWDVVLTTRGSVGHFAIFSEDVTYDHMRINSGMVILRADSTYISSKYLYAFCKSGIMSSTIDDAAFGNAQQQLTVAGIKKLPLYYPSPEEQQKISECLSNVDNLITTQTQKLETLKTHKKGLMQQLFPSSNEQTDLNHG